MNSYFKAFISPYMNPPQCGVCLEEQGSETRLRGRWMQCSGPQGNLHPFHETCTNDRLFYREGQFHCPSMDTVGRRVDYEPYPDGIGGLKGFLKGAAVCLGISVPLFFLKGRLNFVHGINSANFSSSPLIDGLVKTTLFGIGMFFTKRLADHGLNGCMKAFQVPRKYYPIIFSAVAPIPRIITHSLDPFKAPILYAAMALFHYVGPSQQMGFEAIMMNFFALESMIYNQIDSPLSLNHKRLILLLTGATIPFAGCYLANKTASLIKRVFRCR